MELLRRQVLPLFTIKKEHGAILLALLLFLQFPWISRSIDRSAAPIDPGALSAVVLAVLALLLFKAITWWLVNAVWPMFAEYSAEQFELDFKTLLSWQKVCIYLSFYLLLLYSFVAVLAALM